MRALTRPMHETPSARPRGIERAPTEPRAPTGAEALQRAAGNRAVRSLIEAPASRPLPYRDVIQRAFGRHDVSAVRASTGPAASRAARSLDAEAFTVGERVAFDGAPSLETAAHEAAHVVQQRSGLALPGGAGRAGDAFERHADAAARAVVEGRSAEALLDAFVPAADARPVLQCKGKRRRHEVEDEEPEVEAAAAAEVEVEAEPDDDDNPRPRTRRRRNEPTKEDLDSAQRIASTRSHVSEYRAKVDNPQRAADLASIRAQDAGHAAQYESNLATAKTTVTEAESQMDAIEAEFDAAFQTFIEGDVFTRAAIKAFNDEQLGEHRTALEDIERSLVEIDASLTLPSATKTFVTPDLSAYSPANYHTGASGDPIPIVWYKRPADYDPITVKQGRGRADRYKPFKGPSIQIGSAKQRISVAPANQLAKNKEYVNVGPYHEARTKLAAVRKGLYAIGADILGRDIDHVTDLGFSGKDDYDNMWPLDETINRRPFHGWRALYGVHYKNSSGAIETKALGALIGKAFVIKDYLQPGDQAVPAEGRDPEAYSGTSKTRDADLTAAPKPKKKKPTRK